MPQASSTLTPRLPAFFLLLLGLLLALLALPQAQAAASSLAGFPPPSVWPLPSAWSRGPSTFSVSKALSIQLNISNDILSKAANRFIETFLATNLTHLVIQYPVASRPPKGSASISALHVGVGSPSSDLFLGVDESYTLVVDTPAVSLSSATIWGALRGLETLSQLVQEVPATIVDQPRFPWRGYLLDTARHFIPVPTIKKLIDAISQIKLNVFHWHLTDAEAFPLLLSSRPELAKKGAWSPKATYSPQDIQDVIKHAKYRGVRVVPEIDTPGHTFSWGLAYPDIILNCTKVMQRSSLYPNPNNACFDMTNPLTYAVLSDVMRETASLFSDPFFHLGGDEVAFSCLDEFPRIKTWMVSQGMNSSNYADLIQYYTQRLKQVVKDQAGKNMVMWQEAYFNSVANPTRPKAMPNGTIFHVWANANASDVLSTILKADVLTLYSSGWYLDQQVPSISRNTHYLWEDTFIDFYNNEPTANLTDVSPAQLQRLLGGEACQWGEQIDAQAVWTRTFPRVAAVAERLWSPQSVTDSNDALRRAFALTCRLAQRGFQGSSPLRPDYCELP